MRHVACLLTGHKDPELLRRTKDAEAELVKAGGFEKLLRRASRREPAADAAGTSSRRRLAFAPGDRTVVVGGLAEKGTSRVTLSRRDAPALDDPGLRTD